VPDPLPGRSPWRWVFASRCRPRPSFASPIWGVFDLCIEALSDKERSGIERDVETKRDEYAAGGVPEYYILHRTRALQYFFALDASRGIYVPIPPIEGVIHSRVLPGFKFRIEDLERRPPLESLRNDPVYRDFVLTGWGEAEERAEVEAAARVMAEERAETEAAARVAAEERAEAAEAELRRIKALLADRGEGA